jgi:hypothetical protein
MTDGKMSVRRGRKLRVAAGLILVLGIGAADVIYWRGTRSTGLPDDPSLLGYDKVQARQLGTLYGQQGVLTQEWADDLKQPRTQAIIIVVISALAATACFYVAGLMDSSN